MKIIVEVPDNVPALEIGLNNGHGCISELVTVSTKRDCHMVWSWLTGWGEAKDDFDTEGESGSV